MSAITIPTLAYNYRAKVLEEQYRSAYSDLKQIGAMINYEKGDVGEYANKVSLTEWEKNLQEDLMVAVNLNLQKVLMIFMHNWVNTIKMVVVVQDHIISI